MRCLFVLLMIFVVWFIIRRNVTINNEITESTTSYPSQRFSCLERNYSLFSILAQEKYNSIQTNPHLILTSSNKGYKGLLLNWMFYLKIHNIEEYLVLCFDSETFDIVGDWRDDGGYGILIEDCLTRNQIYEVRHQVARILIEQGYTIILSDSDCLWLQNFLQNWMNLLTTQTIDIIAQIGTYPIDLYDKYGYTVCAGLMILFPTLNTRNFYQQLIEKFSELDSSQEEIDDQFLINHLLDGMNSFHSFSPEILLPHSLLQSSSYRPNLLNSNHHQMKPFLHLSGYPSSQLNLSFFPFEYFPRISSKLSVASRLNLHHSYRFFSLHFCPFVWHMKPPHHHPSSSIYQLKRLKLFLLSPGWQDIHSFQERRFYFHQLISKFQNVRNQTWLHELISCPCVT
jgi:hypothetical protein